jgi:hypothetical protein
MRFGVHFFQPSDAHVRVNLSGRELSVSEEFLYQTQIGARIQEVRRVRMSKLVRSQIQRKSCECQISFQE